MSDIDAAVETAPAAEGKPSRRKLVIILAAVLLAGGGAAVVVPGLLGGSAEASAETVEEPTEGLVVPLEPMTASIGGAQAGYVRLGIALVLVEGITAEQVTDRFPLVQDAALSALSQYEPAQLRTPEGIETLRADLGDRVRAIYADGEVLRVVLTELLVQ